MRRAIAQVQMQRVRTLAYQDALLRQRDSRRRGRADVGNEHSLPNRCALGALNILDVKYELREALVKNPWLNLKGSL